MEKKKASGSVTLDTLWTVFRERFWAIVLAGVAAMLMLFAYSQLMVEPLYRSTATLYILRRENEADYVYTQSDFSLAKDVVNDCNYVLKSGEVLDEVIERLNLDMSSSKLARSISTKNPENTRFLEVSVTTNDPKLSKQIVDIVCDIGSKQITRAMGFSQVNNYSSGTKPTLPSNMPGLKRYALTGILTSTFVFSVFVVMQLMNRSIRTEEDVSNALRISVLGVIPAADDTAKRRSGKYGRYYASKEEKK